VSEEIECFEAATAGHLDDIRGLFLEYADSLVFDLEFQDFKSELESLPGEYSEPNGCLIIACFGGEIAGCAALRRISEGVCEMKRMYVKPEFRRKGIGRELAGAIIRKAREQGYKRMRLDTVPTMRAAVGLYRKLGFKVIDPYRFNPIEGAIFFELQLT